MKLSTQALELLAACIGGRNPQVDETNRPAYRELTVVGIMYPVSGMFSGPESNFRFTEEGWSRREEWIALPAGSP